ncbi:hypothetical protein [Fluviicola taffensis]|uniref:Uncharacterized protein n=1 Tax=Fluviicola taffensis (strain DSM 16823 / NCIMB 13979 / RW262) TaxID=755732 RepID=F2ICQ2_FLUTR|nr:hypothetical protein [Fluviicola taffensis]AEA42279.1 hypothetical protein Fluta_0270 [Fluviicola taffensis DSM 16823]
MKNFWRRVRFYGVGFGIGLIFVFFFFRNRGCTWLPENRVKNTIMGKVLVVSDANQKLLDKHHLNDSTIVTFLDDGSISFGSSKKQGNLKVYKVTKEVNGKSIDLWFSIPEGGFVSEVIWPKGSIQSYKNTITGFGRMIHFPNVKNFVYLKENDVLSKQMVKFGLKDDNSVQFLLKKSGLIDFSKSKLNAEPTPEQYIVIPRKSGDTLKARTTWFKDHIEFYEFEEN